MCLVKITTSNRLLMTVLLGMYDTAVSIKFREAKKFLKFKISWLMPLIIFINGQFLEKLRIGN